MFADDKNVTKPILKDFLKDNIGLTDITSISNLSKPDLLKVVHTLATTFPMPNFVHKGAPPPIAPVPPPIAPVNDPLIGYYTM